MPRYKLSPEERAAELSQTNYAKKAAELKCLCGLFYSFFKVRLPHRDK